MAGKTEHPIRVGKPKWLRKKLPSTPEYERVRKLLRNSSLTTVCKEAQCPNQFECYSRGTATFMILGERCSRNCSFCAVEHGPSGKPDGEEPGRVADAVRTMGLQYSVITSVTRDDLEDGGASHFVTTIEEIRNRAPETLVEILIPDLQGKWGSLNRIVAAGPDVLNHNVETVPRLYDSVRPQADYRRSLELLMRVREAAPEMLTKSGIMLGLGEKKDELLGVMEDLLEAGCTILTLGQYLQPSRRHPPVVGFVHPDEFDGLKKTALNMGFRAVAAGPSVRSSYEAGRLYAEARRDSRR